MADEEVGVIPKYLGGFARWLFGARWEAGAIGWFKAIVDIITALSLGLPGNFFPGHLAKYWTLIAGVCVALHGMASAAQGRFVQSSQAPPAGSTSPPVQ
jgi:hypothetical protein